MSLFRRPATQHGDFAMIQPQRAVARSAAARKVADQPQRRREQPSSTDLVWQAKAYEYVEEIGELGFVQHLRANVVAASSLRVAELVPGADAASAPQPSTDPRARRVLDAFVGPRGGQSELLRKAALHLSIAGEALLIGTPGEGGGIVWEFLSVEELRTATADGRPQRRTLTGGWVEVAGESYIARCWRSDPRWSYRADSEVRRCLNLCAQLVMLDRWITSLATSRLPAGLLFLPEELSWAAEDAEDTDGGLDAFLEELFSHLTEPRDDASSAASLVPLVLRGKAEYGEKIKLIELYRPTDALARELRTETLARLARSLDVPPEVVEGMSGLSGLGGGNVAAQIDVDLVAKHVVPLGELLADFLTYAYLRPMLEEYEGMTPEESARFVIEFVPRPDGPRPEASPLGEVA